MKIDPTINSEDSIRWLFFRSLLNNWQHVFYQWYTLKFVDNGRRLFCIHSYEIISRHNIDSTSTRFRRLFSMCNEQR